MATEFCLLGPFVVRSGGVVVPVQPGKQRAVLAALLLKAGRVVPLDELAEALWGSAPPPSARVTVRNYVKRLRQALGDTARARISTHPRGYVISLAAGELDVTRFEALLESAQAAVRDRSWDTAADRARAALALWRGEPLADVASEVLAARELPRLAELRLQAIEVRIDADLHRGLQADVIAELRQLSGVHPLQERLHALLMLALYLAGRQGEALAAYQRARRILVEELGTEPGTGLRELHQQILTADPDLNGPETRPPWGRPWAALPRQVPAAVAHFVGRSGELAELDRLLNQAGEERPGTMVISAIGGTAGVGKTALALYWAHQVADQFPDGQLYVNLRGYDPDQPLPATDALAGFLRALCVPGQDIPAEVGERAARYRSLLAGRRVLVVLDNASGVEQVRPLLPGTPSCVVVVTSRDSLAGLVARDGARRVNLDLLPPADAAGLLRALIGARAAADPAATAALADQCSRLPLALRVAAEFAAARPAVPLADMVSELADRRRRLDLLNASGDRRTAVRTVFSWSYRHLDSGAARAFRLLGLNPGPALGRYAAAALTDATLERAEHTLDLLVRAHLVQQAGPGRYGMHDLLRTYARELGAAGKTEGERKAALTRLFDHYLYTTAAAMDTLFPAERDYRPRICAPATPGPPVTIPDVARAWLDTERASLVAAAVHAATRGWPDHATRLAATLFRYLDRGGYCPEAITIHTCARRAARETGDRAAEAGALISLGVACWQQGSYRQAAGHLEQALDLCRELDDRLGAARALNALSLADMRQGRYQQATGHLQQALDLFGEIGDRTGTAYALGNLGVVDLRQGRYQQATGHLQQALDLFREIGDRTGEARALNRLADVDLRQGRYQQATGHHLRALDFFREAGDRSGQVEALNGLGEAFLAAGHSGRARGQHAAALGLASEIGERHGQARAHDGIAHSFHASGDADQSRYHWEEAFALYAELGTPEADQVRAHLDSAFPAGEPHQLPVFILEKSAAMKATETDHA